MIVTELRIGNVVTRGKIKSLYYDGTAGLDNGISYPLDVLDPILLVPDLFKVMDVAIAGGGWYSWGNEGFDFSIDHQGCMDPTSGCRLHDYPMLYLHQLQNWYYFKTGKELEINL